jgi:hypothetical protein
MKSMEVWWNYTDKKKLKYSEKPCPSATLMTVIFNSTRLCFVQLWYTTYMPVIKFNFCQ